MYINFDNLRYSLLVSEGGKYLGPRQSRSDYKKSLLNYPLRKSMSNFDDEMLTGKSLFLSSARLLI